VNEKNSQEFRFKNGDSILNYIRQFSATEKALFGIFVLAALLSTSIMALRANGYFMIAIPTRGGEIHEGVVGLPRTINPVVAVTDVDRDISSLVHAGLTKYSGGSIIPDLASTWKISEDGLFYTFTLREDARFQDGKPLTADDVVFTIQKIQDPALKSPRRPDWVNVSVRKISDTEVQFILKQPYAPFLTNTTVGIIPKHIWGSVNDEQFIFSQYNTEPVGAGPYRVSSISRDNGGIPTVYRLTTWRNYHGKIPYIPDIYFHFFPDEDKALTALDAGTIDSLSGINAQNAARLSSNSAQPYKVLSSPLPRIFGVFFNQNQASVLADKTVRQALDLAINRNAIIKSALSGYGVAIRGPLTPLRSQVIPEDDGDIEEAQKLLEKNGWKKDEDGIYEKKSKNSVQKLSFDIHTVESTDLKQIAEMVRADWKSLGAEVNIKVFESSDLYQNVIRTRKYDALLFGEFIGKDRDIYAFWHSSQRNAPGLNIALYTNSEVDKLLENIRTTEDEDERRKHYEKLGRIIESDVPAVFLYAPDFIYVTPKNLRGIELSHITMSSDRWNSIGSWYLKTEKVWKIFTTKK